MSLMNELYTKSKQLYEHMHIEYPLEEAEQEVHVGLIASLLEERQQLIEQILQMTEMTEADMRVLEEVLRLDKVTEQKIVTVKSRIGRELGDLRLRKQKSQQYENPYNRSTIDGVFFDKRGV